MTTKTAVFGLWTPVMKVGVRNCSKAYNIVRNIDVTLRKYLKKKKKTPANENGHCVHMIVDGV